MCTWFYADKATLSPIITKAQQLPLADTIRNTMSRSAEMSGNIRPTDMAAVFAPNKQGNMAVFPMIWGFTVEQSSKPLIDPNAEITFTSIGGKLRVPTETKHIRTIAGDDRYETEIKHISGYIRKLPDGQKASERAVTLAQSLGYDLADNETYVQPFERSSWIIRK